MNTKEKTYLNWYNKIGYGSGDIAGNVVYALLSAFVMIFLTDTVGMNAGIVGAAIGLRHDLPDGYRGHERRYRRNVNCRLQAI